MKANSIEVFKLLGDAEAKVHGTTINKIHFHEVGAVDSIIDIVGGSLALHMLDADKIYASPINSGEGIITCDHGVFPVPAPAALELLKGIPSYSSGIENELATPTGVAMIKHFADDFRSMPLMNVEKIGYGAGAHIIKELPNMLRLIVGECMEDNQDKLSVVETNIDDMNPEFYDHVMESLFNAGAVDVYFTPIIMKKNRPAIKVSALVSKELHPIITNILLKETTTFGVRSFEVDRTVLERSIKTLSTPWGKAKVKIGMLDGNTLHISPEYDDCKRIANKNNISLNFVYREILKLADKKFR